jgi:8-oxo-dGTP diphosphatase
MTEDEDWHELLVRIVAKRGIDFEPLPATVARLLPHLVHEVADVVGQLSQPPELRWLAAALAALSHQTQAAAALAATDPAHIAESRQDGPRQDQEVVAIAVVVSAHGVLAGKRRDGMPRWTLPGGKIQLWESPADAAVREVAEECGLTVRAGVELGRRVHPQTGREMVYLACERVDDTPPRVASPRELVHVCWLDLDQLRERMPDLYPPVGDYLHAKLK